MKFTISSGELLTRLQTMGKIIDDKATTPALENFLFSVRGNKLIITASNQEMRMVSSVDISNEEGNDSDVCVPGAKLTDYIKYLPEQPITFTVTPENNTLEIASLSGKSVQTCMSADEYPQEQDMTGEIRKISLTENVILAGINSTLFATANDDLRPVMNSIYFDIMPGQVVFVATDTHKLVRYIRRDVEVGDQTTNFILGKKPANVLKGILTKTDSNVDISFNKVKVVFETPMYRYSCRLAEGNYPQYNSVIPTSNEFRVTVNRTDLLNAVTRASVFVDATHLVRCELYPNSIQISTQDLDFSCSANETIPCEYNGNELVIGFSGKYLNEVLNNIDSQDIVIELASPDRPGIISPSIQKDNEEILILIMPMKV